MHAVGVDSKAAARPGVQLSSDSHPLDELRGIDEVGEHGCRRRGYQLLDLQGLVSRH
jgi:hypothetical protein